MPSESFLRLGTSAFTADGWAGTFYPKNLKPADYLAYYAEHFDTVEVDSTFYHAPSLTTVQGWFAKTPTGFLFAVKIPQSITHEKVLVDCKDEMNNFLRTMDALGEKLGPLLFQFPHFNRNVFRGVNDFLARLIPFLSNLPKGYRFAVEVRNKNWLVPQFVETLRSHGIALALVDLAWMPRPSQLFEKLDPITADFTYVRWLGDRKGIAEQTKTWDRVIVDRRVELAEWVEVLGRVHQRRVEIFAYANNHFAGHGPATVEMFRDLWRAKGMMEPEKPRPLEKEPTLFD